MRPEPYMAAAGAILAFAGVGGIFMGETTTGCALTSIAGISLMMLAYIRKYHDVKPYVQARDQLLQAKYVLPEKDEVDEKPQPSRHELLTPVQQSSTQQPKSPEAAEHGNCTEIRVHAGNERGTGGTEGGYR